MQGSPLKALLLGLSLLLILIIGTNGNRYELNEDNWKLMLEGEWMVQFVAPWCPSCKIVAPIWQRFEKVSDKFNVKVGTVDITKSPALSGRFFVTRLPSIYHVMDGKFRYYRGQRDIDALTDFIKLKEWKNVAPLSRWNDPNAYHMGILSSFFRISLMLKEWNARLQYEFGYSAYSSYGLFVLGTILIGAIFGLLLITLMDYVCPSKKRKRLDFDFKFDIKKPQTEVQNATDNENPIKHNVDDLAEEKDKDQDDDKDDDKDFFDMDNDGIDNDFVDAHLTYELQEHNDTDNDDNDEEVNSVESEDLFKEHVTYKNLLNNTHKRYTF